MAANSWLRPLELALPDQQGLHGVPQFDQHLDVQRRVDQPVVRQRPRRPVGGAMTLAQGQPEDLLDERAEAHPRQAGEPSGQFGVEQPAGADADLGQAGQVLIRGVQHPFRARTAAASRTLRSPSGIGSSSAVPRSGRRSCTR